MELRVPVDFNDIARMIREMEDFAYVEEFLLTALFLLLDFTEDKREFDQSVLDCYQHAVGSGLEFL